MLKLSNPALNILILLMILRSYLQLFSIWFIPPLHSVLAQWTIDGMATDFLK